MRLCGKELMLFFQHYISYIAVASAPIHTFLEFFLLVLHAIFFASQSLLSHITIIETMDSRERGMNLVAIFLVLHTIVLSGQSLLSYITVVETMDNNFSLSHKVFGLTKEKLHHLNQKEIVIFKCYEFRQG